MKTYQDYFFHKAKTENYPARSIYKLKEIDAKFRLLRKNLKVLDLGASPGSWSLGCAEKVGENGIVISCDLRQTDTEFPQNVKFYQEDIYNISPAFTSILQNAGPFNLVISDMAPATTGSRFTDQFRSYELADKAFEIARQWLVASGNFVVKIFMGPDVKVLQEEMNTVFKDIKVFKPKSSRAESKETFLIGLNYIGLHK